MRILNYEVHFGITRRHSFWDLLRTPTGGIVPRDCPFPEEHVQWEHTINPEKRLHAMHSDILVYAFRDVALKMISFPDEAPAIFLGIVSFTEIFKKNMIQKGASEESIIEYDIAVDNHIESTLNIIKRNNPEIYNGIVDYLEDE